MHISWTHIFVYIPYKLKHILSPKTHLVNSVRSGMKKSDTMPLIPSFPQEQMATLPQIPPWLHNISNPSHIANKSLQVLTRYEICLDTKELSVVATELLGFLNNAGYLQIYIDRYMLDPQRQHITTILHAHAFQSFGTRLELRKTDIWRRFRDSFYTDIVDGRIRIAYREFNQLINGDTTEIYNTWPKQYIIHYRPLDADRIHMHTLLHIALACDPILFETLWCALFGSPIKTLRTDLLHTDPLLINSLQPTTSGSMSSVCIPTTLRDMINYNIETINTRKAHQIERRRLKKKRQRHRRLQLRQANADYDDNECTVCFNERATTVFYPCQHRVCCQSCANKITICCICREVITDKQESIHQQQNVTPISTHPIVQRDNLVDDEIILLTNRLYMFMLDLMVEYGVDMKLEEKQSHRKNYNKTVFNVDTRIIIQQLLKRCKRNQLAYSVLQTLNAIQTNIMPSAIQSL